jgi:hypothetical protein
LTVRLASKPLAPGLALVAMAITLLGSNSSGQVPMGASSWLIGPVLGGRDFSPGMPQHPTDNGKGGWYFDFPRSCGKQPDCSVHYVSARVSGIRPKESVSASFTVTASADAMFNCLLIPKNPEGYDPSAPPHVVLMLEHTGDDQEMTKEFWRYFAYRDRVALKSGTYNVTVPLTPSRWVDVLGKPGDSKMSDTLNNLGDVAVVFGGCGYAGHGVQMQQGAARFALNSFSAD